MYGEVRRVIKPFSARPKNDGSGTYDAMNVELELDNAELVQAMSFKELAIGEKVEVEKNGKYWNIVQKPRQLNKPGQVNNVEVMGALRTTYTLLTQVNAKIDMLLNDQKDAKQSDISVKSSGLGNATPTNGWEQARQRFSDDGIPKAEVDPRGVDPVYEVTGEPINLDDIPF